MTYNLTQKQKDLLKWFVEQVRAELLPEEFMIYFFHSDYYQLDGFKGPRENCPEDISKSMLDALEKEDLIQQVSIQDSKTFKENGRRCAINQKGYEAVDSDFDNISPSNPEQIMPTPLLDNLEGYGFHPEVVKLASTLFNQGHYRPAILDTYIGLVGTVQSKSGLTEDNSKLMQKAFSADNPRLKLSDDKDEQLGFMWLFSGAVMAIRNPRAHKIVDDTDKQKALETLAFASRLFRLLEEAVIVGSPT